MQTKSFHALRRSLGGLDLVAAVLIGACCLWLMPLNVMISAKNDFAPLYVAGQLAGSSGLYSPDVFQQHELDTLGFFVTNCLFQRPPFYALLLKPLGWLPYRTAYTVFQVSSLVCVVGFLWTFARARLDLLLLTAMCIPLFVNFIIGQDVTFLLALLTIFIILARHHADFLAGLVLSLCAIKFHLFVLIPVAILLQRRFRIFWGALAGGLVLGAVGLLNGGLMTYPRLLALMRDPSNHPGPEHMTTLRGFVFAFMGDNIAMVICLTLVVVGVVIFLAWKADSFETAVGYCLIGGLLVSFHAYIQDCLVLLLALVLFAPVPKFKFVGAWLTVALLPLPYMMIELGPPYSMTLHVLLFLTLAASILAERHPRVRTEPTRELANELR